MDREKVINELVEYIESALYVDSDYVDGVRTDLLQTVVVLLKEQEAVEPKIVEKECAGPTNYYCFCQRCGNYLGCIVKKKDTMNYRKNFCDNCGLEVKWE